jgi:hypothetical protein
VQVEVVLNLKRRLTSILEMIVAAVMRSHPTEKLSRSPDGIHRSG